MGITVTSGHSSTYNSWHSVILWQTIARMSAASISASSTDTDEAYAEAPVSDQTWEWWKPSSMPAWWKVDAGEAVTVDCIGIAAHNLSTQNCTVKVQYSTNDSDWNDVTDATATPSTDAPVMILFAATSARYWRIYITSSDSPQSAPRICVIYIGEALEMQRPIKWLGHTPGVLNRRIEKRANESVRGQRLGTTLIRQGFQADFEVNNLPELWVRGDFDDFVQSAWRYGYFVAWRPEDFTDDVLFGWTEDPIIATNEGHGKLPRSSATTTDGRRMSVSWSMRAHGGWEEGIVPWGST